MTPEDKAKQAVLRMRAAYLRAEAAKCDLVVAAISAKASLSGVVAAMQAGYDRDLAEHPDLAELNVQLNSYYA